MSAPRFAGPRFMPEALPEVLGEPLDLASVHPDIAAVRLDIAAVRPDIAAVHPDIAAAPAGHDTVRDTVARHPAVASARDVDAAARVVRSASRGIDSADRRSAVP